MELFVFSIYDTAATVFAQPFFAPSEAVAVRSFKDLVNGSDNKVAQHPEDYVLFHLGMYDDNTGGLEARGGGPRQVLRGLDIKRVQQ